MSQSVVEPFENIYDRLRGIGFPQKSEHETAFYKMDRQKALATLFADHGIHLYDVSVRIFLQESVEVLIVSPKAAAFVHLELGLAAFDSETDTPRQIDVFTSRSPASM